MTQRRIHEEIVGATSAMVGSICPPWLNRVKVSENLDATAVVPVASVDTYLSTRSIYFCERDLKSSKSQEKMILFLLLSKNEPNSRAALLYHASKKST